MQRGHLPDSVLQYVHQGGVFPVQVVQVPGNVVRRRRVLPSWFLDGRVQRRAQIFQLFLERSKPLTVDLGVSVRPVTVRG